MSSSIDPTLQNTLRFWLRIDFGDKKLQTINDELDSAYEQMRTSVRRKETTTAMLLGCGIGAFYGMYLKPILGKGNYLRKTICVMFAISFIDAAEGIVLKKYTNYDLENKMIERYQSQILQNHPKIKEKLKGTNPHGGIPFGNPQGSLINNSQYQNNQNFNWQPSQSQNLWSQDANNRQIENWNTQNIQENQNYQNPRDLVWNPDPQGQFNDYLKPQANDWNSQNSWDKENLSKQDLGYPNFSKYDSLGNRKPVDYKNSLNNQNNHYPGATGTDEISVPYYPGVPPARMPNQRH
ncbi:unnamed protein product [Blepharisma stoltei]|uniref:Uncharacterized protein n=1 Tax=Blepharisma stoltei TaxID=1481888 RepID=A0AAU9KKU0_9CILI|nr:unnamed protein product [Blepharisma stoltei]